MPPFLMRTRVTSLPQCARTAVPARVEVCTHVAHEHPRPPLKLLRSQGHCSHTSSLCSHTSSLCSHTSSLCSHTSSLCSHTSSLCSHTSSLCSHTSSLCSHTNSLCSHVSVYLGPLQAFGITAASSGAYARIQDHSSHVGRCCVRVCASTLRKVQGHSSHFLVPLHSYVRRHIARH